MQPTLVFTDLDGTLLNHHDYSYRAALPAIERLRREAIPLILVSSKTRSEMASLCEELGIADPYVCENGSVIVMTDAWAEAHGVDRQGLIRDGDCWLSLHGAERGQIVALLKKLKQRYAFTGFADMDVAQVVAATGLDEESAHRAMRRSASEPIIWEGSQASLADFAQQLGEEGLRVLKGGRFYHVMADCDKSDAVRYLLSLYESHLGASVRSIALGDSPNDLVMLKAVDQAVVMPHRDGTYMHDDELVDAIRAPFEGARGWRAGVEQALDAWQ